MLPRPLPTDASKACPVAQSPNWRALVYCACGLGAVWLGVLPQIAELPRWRAYVQRNHEYGIDPSAKFYTEQPASADALLAIEAAQRLSPKAWGLPSPPPSDSRVP